LKKVRFGDQPTGGGKVGKGWATKIFQPGLLKKAHQGGRWGKEGSSLSEKVSGNRGEAIKGKRLKKEKVKREKGRKETGGQETR